MTLLEAIILEMNEHNRTDADGINVCELIDQYNITLLPDHQLLQDGWKEINGNDNKNKNNEEAEEAAA